MKDEKQVQKVEEKAVVMSQDQMIAQAVTNGADLKDLHSLFDLKLKHEANEAKKAYHVAMAAFKENPPEIVKDKAVAYKEVKYKHASLANVVDKINAGLSKHGLSASWQTAQNGTISVTCKITHAMGHSEETTLTAPSDTTGSKNVIQAIGSTISYLQRYTILALTGLATSDMDDDGKGSEAVDCIDDKQIIRIREFLDNGVDEKRFLAYMKLESVEDIPKDKFQVAIVALENALKKTDTVVQVEEEGK